MGLAANVSPIRLVNLKGARSEGKHSILSTDMLTWVTRSIPTLAARGLQSVMVSDYL